MRPLPVQAIRTAATGGQLGWRGLQFGHVLDAWGGAVLAIAGFVLFGHQFCVIVLSIVL